MSAGARLANPNTARFQPGTLVQVGGASQNYNIFQGDANHSIHRWNTRKVVEGEKFIIKASGSVETVIVDTSGQTWWTYTEYFERIATSI